MDGRIARLGTCNIPSPLVEREFTPDDARVLYDSTAAGLAEGTKDGAEPPSFEQAGPRERIFFDPKKLKAGIVTCGGLSPGMNDVIRALVLECCNAYGMPPLIGFRYGYQGLAPEYGHDVVELTPESVADIHYQGGTVLASSRGHQDIGVMVDTLDRMNVRALFTIGGDGTQRAASLMAKEIEERGLKIAIVGLPKTIDNDLKYVTQSFGFITAISVAREAVTAGYTEAHSAPNGIGLVRLMGRTSGWIAAHATLASGGVDFCLIPEAPFRLDGDDGLLAMVRKTLEQKRYCVIVAAEGAGQDLTPGEPDRDASGNLKLKDIGLYLRAQLIEYFDEAGIPINLKYVDPSYIIRCARAQPADAVFCQQLAQNAVHAAMAGRTNMLVGYWNRYFTHVPLDLVTAERKRIEPTEQLWQAVLSATGQPPTMGYDR